MAIEYSEIDGYPQEQRDTKTFRAVRKVRCAWNDRTALRELFMAYPGHLYPYAESFGARAVDVSIQGVGKQAQDNLGESLAYYDWADLTITYEQPEIQPHPNNPNPSAAFSEYLRPWTEGAKLDYRLFTWEDDTPLLPEEAPLRTFRRLNYRFRRHFLTQVPLTAMALQGKINDASVSAISYAGLTFAAQTLFMESAELETSRDAQGNFQYDVTYSMLYKPETWRKHFRADAAPPAEEFQKIQIATVDFWFPREADFSVIFA